MPSRGPFSGVTKGQALFAVSAGGVAALAAGMMLSTMDGGAAPLAPPVAGAVTADGREFAVTSFKEISTVGPHRVEVTVGGEHSVRAVGPAEALDRFEVVVEGGTLSIRPRESNWRRVRWGRMEPATYFVTLPSLEAATLAGSGTLRVDRVEGERFRGNLAGSGEIAIAALQVEDADFTIAGSGDLLAAGTARNTRVSIFGSGDVRARELSSESATVRIMGSGDTALTVQRDARIAVMGRGDVDIAGPASCSVSRMGRGDVSCNEVAVD